MNDLSMYVLHSYQEIEAFQQSMGKEAFCTYRDKIYSRLMGMKRGDELNIPKIVKRENLELFIKVVCLFISEGGYTYSFSQDFNIIRNNG